MPLSRVGSGRRTLRNFYERKVVRRSGVFRWLYNSKELKRDGPR